MSIKSSKLAHHLLSRSMKFLWIIIFFSFLKSQSQDVISSNTSLKICNDGENCETLTGTSYLFYDESKSEFYLKLDFKNFIDSTHLSFRSMLDSIFYFKAIMPTEDFPQLGNQATQNYKLNGKIFYNNIWKEQTVDLSIYVAENSLLNVSSNNANFRYDSYKVNFNVPFVPKDFAETSSLSHLNQTISLGVTLGRINLLKPGMEFLLAEVYFHASR
jgi:hypothetical protein